MAKIAVIDAHKASRQLRGGQAGRSLKMLAYEELKRRIQGRELEPGQMTTDSELSRQLKMSRTPVREALTMLERDYLVTRIPNQGVLIRDFSIDEIIHVLNMREAIDGMAARLSAGRMNAAILDELQTEFEELKHNKGPSSTEKHAALSRRLHGAIIEATCNTYLQSASETLRGVFERTRQHGWRIWAHSEDNEAISARRCDEHLAIIESIKQKDPEAAERAARLHVATALRDMLKLLAR